MIDFVITITIPRFCPPRFSSTRCELCGEMLETYKVVKVKVGSRNALFHATCAWAQQKQPSRKPVRHPWLPTAMRELPPPVVVKAQPKSPNVNWRHVAEHTRRTLRGAK